MMDEWISVEERMPEEGTSVLVGWAGMDNNMIAFRHKGMWGDTWKLPCFEGVQPPTHWQRLPESPKEQGPFHIGVPDSKYPPVHCRGFGYISTQSNTGEAREVCKRLNQLWAQDKGSTEDEHDPPKEPEPLPLFYMQPGSWLCPIHTVYLRGYGRIIALMDRAKAQSLSHKLNEVWDLDLDKGSNEDEHDTDTTATNSGTNRSTCCTDGGACRRSV